MALLDPANAIASRDEVLASKDLLHLILSHLDPASIKEAVQVSRWDIKLYRNVLMSLLITLALKMTK